MASFVRDVEALARDDADLAAKCHPAMHELGRSRGTAAARAQRDPVFPEGSSQLCTAGYVHGLAEGYLTGAADAEVLAVFPKLCHDTSARAGCAHGVGHALIRARTEMPAARATTSAADRCRELPGDFPANCMNGVFMELAMRREPHPLPPDQFVESCKSMEIAESLSCWGYLSTNLQSNDMSLSEAPTWCAKASLPGQFSCIEQYGRYLGAEEIAGCTRVDDPRQLRERCVDGAIGLQVGSGQITNAEARDACSELDEGLGRYCSKAVSRYAEGRRKVEAA